MGLLSWAGDVPLIPTPLTTGKKPTIVGTCFGRCFLTPPQALTMATAEERPLGRPSPVLSRGSLAPTAPSPLPHTGPSPFARRASRGHSPPACSLLSGKPAPIESHQPPRQCLAGGVRAPVNLRCSLCSRCLSFLEGMKLYWLPACSRSVKFFL